MFDIWLEVWENVCRWAEWLNGFNLTRKAHSMNTITAWTHDDLLTDLKAEVLEVRNE